MKLKDLFLKQYFSSSFQILLLRLILGAVVFAHGAKKLPGWFGGSGFNATLNSFEENLGIPPILGFLAIISEFFGGMFLALGLLTRISALAIGITMAVAVFSVHWADGFFLPRGIEFALTLMIISIVIFFSGPGKFSLDQKFFKATA